MAGSNLLSSIRSRHDRRSNRCGSADCVGRTTERLRDQLETQLAAMDDPGCRDFESQPVRDGESDPASLLALFDRDAEALPALLQVFATSQSLANRLISDPESFDLIARQ